MSPRFFRLSAILAFSVLTLSSLAACDTADPLTCTDDFELTMVSDTPGVGQAISTSSTVVVRYKGTLDDGSVFDSSPAFDSTANRSTACLYLPNMITGFRLGVGGITLQNSSNNLDIPPMRLGGRRTIRIPSNLGYGPTSRTGIPACSAINFEIELVDAANGC